VKLTQLESIAYSDHC